MSSNASGGAGDKVPGLVPLGSDDQGRAMFAMPYNESLAKEAVGKGLAEKTQPAAAGDDSDRESTTPDPDADYETREDAGPIRRFNEVFTNLGSVQLEALGLDGNEIANSIATLRDEIYRSHFPVIEPRFVKKCEDEDCGTEYDKDVDFCIECARRQMSEAGVDDPPSDPDEVPAVYQDHPVRSPRPSEKREAARLAESVNKEGQSLRSLMKAAEDDQGRLGISVVVNKKEYAVAAGDTSQFSRGEIIYEGTDELVKGDPKRIVPVVNEDGRVGGHWYACPIHRDERVGHDDWEEGDRRCPECGAEYREVFFAELEGTSRSHRKDIAKVYFQDEIVTWARYYPRLHGLDGLSPVHHVWLKQAILHWMDIYGAAFYDPESEQYPNKFMVVHTTNPRAWEKQFEKAEEQSAEHPYSEQILMNEYSGEANSTPEVQVIDLMQDDLLGQDQQIRDQFKQDIRTNFGVTNIFESEMKEAGGLNNEGLQLEVTDRAVATAMHDTTTGPLDELSKRLGVEDYRFAFIPPGEQDADELEQHIRVGEQAADAGLEARLEDNQVEVSDGEFEAGEEDGGGGLADLFGDFEDAPDEVQQKAERDDVYADPDSAMERAEELGLSGVHRRPYGDGDGEYWMPGGSHEAWERAVGGDDGGADADSAVGAVPPEDADEADGTERTPSTSAAKREPERRHYGDEIVLKLEGEEGNENRRPVFKRRVYVESPDNIPDGARPRVGDQGGVYYETEDLTGADAGVEPGALSRAEEAIADLSEEDQENLAHALREVGHETASRVLEAVGQNGTDFAASVADAGPAVLDALASAGPDLASLFAEPEDGPEDHKADPEKLEQVRKLDDAFEHIVWARGEEQKAEPFWDEDDVVPDFVKDVITDVVGESLWDDFESIPNALGDRMTEVFEEALTQSQGWSLDSITRNIMDAFGADYDDAELVARTESTKVLNEAREEGYERAGGLDEPDRLFRWTGPQDHRTTDACEWLKEQTEDGVTWDRLIELQKEVYDEFDDELGHLEWRKHLIHPNERHTFVETFKLEHQGAAGPVEVEHKIDLAPAMGGTFEAVT